MGDENLSTPPVLPIQDSKDSLIMGNEELSTIPEKESDKVIKSSVEDHVLIPSESEDTSECDSECDLPFCDNSVTFSNTLFNDNDDFTSSDDESLPEEDVLKEDLTSTSLVTDSIPPGIDDDDFDLEGDILLLEKLFYVHLSSTPPFEEI
ncbi:hypothetical protein Tco_0432889 [Tanacetum coccineum]